MEVFRLAEVILWLFGFAGGGRGEGGGVSSEQ